MKQIGRDLNVRYVLEGSVQRGGNRMRVNVQLIDAESGNHLWAERFDKPLADLFDMQDEIVSRLANRLGHELARAEARRAGRSANPDSMDHYFRVWLLQQRYDSRASRQGALSFDRAIDLDPDNVDALVGYAWVDVSFVANWLSEDRVKRLRSAEADLGKASDLGRKTTRPRAIGDGANVQQPRPPRHRRVRAGARHRPQSRNGPCMDRSWQAFCRTRRRDRGSRPRSLAHQPARHSRFSLDAHRRVRQTSLEP